MKIAPKKENENTGFHYTVSEEQLEWYSKLSVKERLDWVFSAYKFINAVQTDEERERMKKAKNFKW